MNASSNALAQSIPVYRAEEFLIIDGANIDETLSFASEAILDDVYELRADAKPKRLSIYVKRNGTYSIAEETQVGTPEARIVVDCFFTVMTPRGTTIEILVLVELDEDEMIANIHVVPLAPLKPGDTYRLVGIEIEDAPRKLAQVACVSFSRGTNITMSSGAQRPIEDLKVGDKVLTRDDGPQEILWIDQHTTRAVGDFAPIVIKAGTLNNTNDLIVSPDHRLFIYQRNDTLGAGRSEVLVKARHLVNGDTIIQEDGGFIDYYQLLFDQHEIIYAEGIAAEALLIDTRTRGALSQKVSEDVMEALEGHSGWLHKEFEVGEDLLGPDAADKLRRASKG